tara:strand:- start:245 stop:517 length:273 start_codon:yes stop_codon:yes gene_type:complete
MTKFEKLNEAILNLGKNWQIKNMNEKNLAPIVDREQKIQNQNRSNLLRMLGDIKFELHFLHNDMRFKWNKKEIVQKIEDLEELIKKKRFF